MTQAEALEILKGGHNIYLTGRPGSGKTYLLNQFIPVLDSFSLALSHGQKEVEPIYKQFLQILKQNGLEESNPLGETFDPRSHEAVGTVETEKESEDHKILEVIQKGYILTGKIIRPAKVKIGEYKN